MEASNAVEDATGSSSTALHACTNNSSIDNQQPHHANKDTKTPTSGTSNAVARYSVDLRLLEYVSEVDCNLICPICHCPFIEPLRLQCDHSFCRHCIGRAFRSQSDDMKTCPTCRSATTSLETFPVPRFFVHLIDDLLVRCPKHLSGCLAHMRRSDVQNHMDHYCEYAEVACSSRQCRQRVARKDQMEECLHKIVSCECCELQMMKGELQNHVQKQCTKRMSQCPNCLLDFIQRDFTEHQNGCPQAQTRCKASGIGCKFVSVRSKTLQHEPACVLNEILPTMQSMQQCIKEQGAALKLLQRRNDELEEGFSAVKALLGDSSTGGYSLPVEVQSLPAGMNIQSATTALAAVDFPPFDSATHHLLSLHESLREDVDRVASAVSNLDARTSMMIVNESLRAKEEMAHTNAAIGSMRMQLQWLTSARLQAQRIPSSPAGLANVAVQNGGRSAAISAPTPVRRSSDSNKQDLKL